MEFVFEIVLQILGEILVQIGFEFLAELGFHSLEDTFKKPKNPVLSTIGFVLWGAMAGGISLLIFPKSLVSNPAFREINLFLTPLAVAGVMMLVGRARDKRGQILVKLDRFGYAFVFAFAMASVRYMGAH